MKKVPVSVVIITKNESLMIGRCLDSLNRFDEVYVVDSNSTDDTVPISESHGARVINFTWNGAYPKKKQWALENIEFSHPWVLYLDGDEYLTPTFVEKVAAVVEADDPRVDAYDVPLEYHFLGKRLRHGHKVKKRILFRHSRCKWEPLNDLGVENPFEMELHVQPVVSGGIATLDEPIVHSDEEPLAHYFDRHNRYSDWEAELRVAGGGTGAARRTKEGNIWARVPGKPLVFFVYAYLYRRGFLDGRAGLYYALAQCLYYAQIDMKTFDSKRRTIHTRL